MTNEEITMCRDALTAQLEGKPWQWRPMQSIEWMDGDNNFDVLGRIRWGCFVRAKPEPTYRGWTMDDVPPICWLREKQAGPWGAGHWCVRGVGVGGVDFGGDVYRYADLLEKYEWSADRKTWQPCRIEVQP